MWENLGAGLKFSAPIIPAVRNLQLCVGIPSEICTVSVTLILSILSVECMLVCLSV